MAKAKFPIIRKKFPIVRAYPRFFVVDGRLRGNGRKEYFVDRKRAIARADQLATERENEGTRALEFTTRDRAMFAECREILLPFNRTLRDAAHHYAAWLRVEEKANTSPLIQDCLRDYLASREQETARGDLSQRSLVETRHFVRRLSAAVGHLRLAEFDAAAVTTFLDSLPVSARTRLNQRLRLSKFFNWCRSKKFLAINPCVEVQVKVRRGGDVTVLSVDDAEKLMRTAESSKFAATMVPFFACGLFGGLRSGEAMQLDWKDIDFRRRTIFVHPETSKRRESRYVHMEPALIAFLRPYAQPGGRIVGANFRKQWESVARTLGDRWNNNVCRHTAVSMLLAFKQNRAAVAEWAGHGVGTLRRFYRRPILKRDAQRFWALRPTR